MIPITAKDQHLTLVIPIIEKALDLTLTTLMHARVQAWIQMIPTIAKDQPMTPMTLIAVKALALTLIGKIKYYTNNPTLLRYPLNTLKMLTN